MTKIVQRNRGTSPSQDEYVGPEGELYVGLTSWDIRIQDGVTPGGRIMASRAWVEDNYQPEAANLNSLSTYNSQGLMYYKSPSIFGARSIAVTDVNGFGNIAIDNGSGVNGNPTIKLTVGNVASKTLGTGTGQIMVAEQISAAISAIIPVGGIIAYSGTAANLAANWPAWKICDGTNGTPDLNEKFILGTSAYTAVGTTGGAFSATATTTLAGYHNHTGVVDGHALSIAEIPAHRHGMPTTMNVVNANSGAPSSGGAWPGGGTAYPFNTEGSGFSHNHGIPADALHAHSVTVSTTPPYYRLVYIMRTV